MAAVLAAKDAGERVIEDESGLQAKVGRVEPATADGIEEELQVDAECLGECDGLTYGIGGRDDQTVGDEFQTSPRISSRSCSIRPQPR